MKIGGILLKPNGGGGAEPRLGYTLAEVVITMLVISVVVGISIKITKTKLNNITSYTYYSAYQTINSVTKEMLRDFDAGNNDYISKTFHLFPAAYADNCFYKVVDENYTHCFNYSIVSACEIFNFDCQSYVGKVEGLTADMCENRLYTAWALANVKGALAELRHETNYTWYYKPFLDKLHNEEASIVEYPMEIVDIPCVVHSYNKYYYPEGTPRKFENVYGMANCAPEVFKAYCPDWKIVSVSIVKSKNEEPPSPGPTPDVCTVTPCEGGNEFDMTSCGCVCKKTAPVDIPCGKEWSETQCQLVDKSPWPPVCPVGQIFKDDASICGCVNEPPTLPRKGENFCKLFVSYSNTAQLSESDECHGTEIDETENDFTDKDADIILRNGMRLYNVSQDPVPIDILSGNSKGVTYTNSDETEIDIDEWGYKVYIDIDGSSGDSKLWEDVYPFYVTLSGTVIPAYDLVNEGLSGGDSRLHLQTSVSDEFIDNNGRHIEWITKSKSFKESACTMGYIKSGTQYCSGINLNAQCNQQGHECRLKTIMPIKFFN